jgi:DNA-directed RNA polymerase sigma subunit (sigma70/sigma32)
MSVQVVTITKVKNKFLHDYTQRTGKSVPFLAKEIGVSIGLLYDLSNLTYASDIKHGAAKKFIERLEEFFKVVFSDIMPPEILELNQQVRREGGSLDKTIIKDHEISAGLLTGPQFEQIEYQTPESVAIEHEDAEYLENLLDRIHPKSAEVIRRRLGLGGRGVQSQAEIARSMGRSSTRIAQLEHRGIRAVGKLRREEDRLGL